MNYDHAFHAGNPADVLKHSALALVLRELTRKKDPIHYLDTHAGAGLFRLDDPTGEWTQGIAKLKSRSARRRLVELEPYLGLLDWQGSDLHEYPGSPLIARALLRPNDRLELVEKKAEDQKALANIVRDRRVTVKCADGYEALRRFRPKKDEKLFAFIDPPFEKIDEWDQLESAVTKVAQKRPEATFVVWYPLKDGPPHEGRPEQLRAALEQARIPGMTVELASRGGMLAPRRDRAKVRGALKGSGLLFVRAPHRATAKVAAAVPELGRSLSRSEHGGGWTASWQGWG